VTRIRLRAGSLSLDMDLKETPTTKALVAALPFEAQAQTWGAEVYFTCPVSVKLEADARQVVEPGTVCFWTQGNALALPFGRTPISTDDRPKLANPCNVLGSITGNFLDLSKIRAGDLVKVEVA
jgi:uncharacterized protein